MELVKKQKVVIVILFLLVSLVLLSFGTSSTSVDYPRPHGYKAESTAVFNPPAAFWTLFAFNSSNGCTGGETQVYRMGFPLKLGTFYDSDCNGKSSDRNWIFILLDILFAAGVVYSVVLAISHLRRKSGPGHAS